MRAVFIVLLLCGCASTPTALIPVNQPCKVPVIQQPDLHYAPGTYSNVFDLVRDLKGDWIVQQSYSEKLKSALDECSK